MKPPTKSTAIGIAAAVTWIVVAVLATVASSDTRDGLDKLVLNAIRFLEEPDAPPGHPTRLKHHYERMAAISQLVVQLDDDIAARSHPRTVNHTIVEIVGHLLYLDREYGRTTVAGSSR